MRTEQAAHGMLPAHQSLGTEEKARAGVDLRLEQQAQLVLLDGPTQLVEKDALVERCVIARHGGEL